MLPNYLKAHLSFSGRGEYVSALGNGKKSCAFSPLLPHNHIWCFWTHIEEISSIYQCDAQKDKAEVCSLSSAQSTSRAASTVISCHQNITVVCCSLGHCWLSYKVKSGRRQRWVSWASVGLGIAGALQISAGLCPAPRCSCCATMKAPGQGQSRWGALQTLESLALSAFKRNGGSVSGGQGTSMTSSGGKMDQGKKMYLGKKKTMKTPLSKICLRESWWK